MTQNATTLQFCNPKPKELGSLFSASELMKHKFPEISYIADNLIPEGLSILAGKPKLGKSWMVCDLCLSVADDARDFVGRVSCRKGDVLYLALEDNHRRLQSRIKKMYGKRLAPERLTIGITWPTMSSNCIDELESWIESVPDPKLIVIDTYGIIKPKKSGKDDYGEDYRSISDLQRLASKHSIAIVLVHHRTKQDSDDPFDSVSGTLGITGGADTIMILDSTTKGQRLLVKGRDICEREDAVAFNRETFIWELLGEAHVAHRSDSRKKILECFHHNDESLSPKEVTERTGLKHANTRKLLGSMVESGELTSLTRGEYSIPNHNNHIITVTT